MLNVMMVLQEFFLAGMARTTPKPRDHEVSQHLHRAILESVRLHSPEAAERAMQAHMEITLAQLVERSRMPSDRGKRIRRGWNSVRISHCVFHARPPWEEP